MASRALTMALVGTVVVAVGCAAPREASGAPLVGPDAVAIVLKLVHPVPATDFQDDHATCQDQGCEEMITTPTVTVSMWPDEPAAAAYRAGHPGSGDFRQVGRFVLSFTGEQLSRADERTRTTLTEQARAMVP